MAKCIYLVRIGASTGALGSFTGLQPHKTFLLPAPMTREPEITRL
jgi:hypothetical protein